MYEIFINGEWVPVEKPNNGDLYRYHDAGGGIFEAIWQEPTAIYAGEIHLKVNGIETSRFVGEVDIPAVFRVECSEPINDEFSVPLQGLFGARGKTLKFQFVDGVAERSVTFKESGEWEVTEAQINTHLPDGHKFMFAGINISIAE